MIKKTIAIHYLKTYFVIDLLWVVLLLLTYSEPISKYYGLFTFFKLPKIILLL